MQNEDSNKDGFISQLSRMWIPITIMAACFFAGYWVKSEIDTSTIDLLKLQIETNTSSLVTNTELETIFLNFDLAQMSPLGEYQLLLGNSSFSTDHSTISKDIDSMLKWIEKKKFSKAKSSLMKIANTMPDYPYLDFYRGITEIDFQNDRARRHFSKAHNTFAQLLRIKPNNSAMRLCDAISLTFIGLGDSASMQLYKTYESNKQFRNIACNRLPFLFDSQFLSNEEINAWNSFGEVLEGLKCDTAHISRSTSAIDVLQPIPEIQWPSFYKSSN